MVNLIIIDRETPLAEIIGQMSLSKSTGVSTQSWVFISVKNMFVCFFTLMKTQVWVETPVLFDNNICPTISGSGVSLSIIMPVSSHAEFFHMVNLFFYPSPFLFITRTFMHIHMHTHAHTHIHKPTHIQPLSTTSVS